jgi:hypothetical protein
VPDTLPIGGQRSQTADWCAGHADVASSYLSGGLPAEAMWWLNPIA